MTAHSNLKFRDLLFFVCEQKQMTQHQLAFHANVSQTAISLVGSHQRRLSPKLAKSFAHVLGGQPEFWLEAYQDFAKGNVADLKPYLDQISGGLRAGQTFGVGTRRLLNFEILEMFDPATRDPKCAIRGFDIRRIGPACYYSRLGFVERNFLQDPQALEHDPTKPVSGKIRIEPREQLIVRTLEDFHFPLWLEADFQAASNVSDMGLEVTNGPTIDPGYEGRLRVTLTNLSPQTVFFDSREHFLKTRFTVFDNTAMAHEEFQSKIRNVEDSEILSDAVADIV